MRHQLHGYVFPLDVGSPSLRCVPRPASAQAVCPTVAHKWLSLMCEQQVHLQRQPRLAIDAPILQVFCDTAETGIIGIFNGFLQ